MIVEDGKGTGYSAQVDTTQRLRTRSVSEDPSIEATFNGDHYAITSGAIDLTSTSPSAMMYFINNEEFPLLIDRIILNSTDSVGGTVDEFFFALFSNCTGMTNGNGNEATQVNTNFSSNNTLNITSEKGAEGASLTGGTQVAGWRIENPTRMRIINVRWVFEKGAGIGVRITPPDSNTSMNTTVALNGHLVKF